MGTASSKTPLFSDVNFSELKTGGKSFRYVSLPEAYARNGEAGRLAARLPVSLKIVLENVLRQGDEEAARAVMGWAAACSSSAEVPFKPARILMQDFTGVPAIVDLAAMRDGMKALGGDPRAVNPLVPVDLVIDHSVTVDVAGTPDALAQNTALEFARNGERYGFLRWGQEAFENFRVIPPGNGICHQVNLEYLAPLVAERDGVLFPDTVFGTDSHTTMINGLGVLGWGVGGIEAEAAALGEPIAMRLPDVIGVRLHGALPAGATATDLVLTLTQMLRRIGVVGKFVEFYGPALDRLPVADRATIANMAPEYGATCGYFPPDRLTMDYLRLTGRTEAHVALAEAYLRTQGLFRVGGEEGHEETETARSPEPIFTQTYALDLGDVRPSMAGPKNPVERHDLQDVAESYRQVLAGFGVTPEETQKRVSLAAYNKTSKSNKNNKSDDLSAEEASATLGHGDVVIAAITSCTNTSNPSVMAAAGLVARNARKRGLTVKPWVKTSLAPGSRAVTEYLDRAGLTAGLDALGFEVVGYGCTSCIGNSGPLRPELAEAIQAENLVTAAVLSGNRNFEGRVSPFTKANYIASPPLVVAYALAGNVNIDLTTAPLGKDSSGQPVYLRDIWPAPEEIAAVLESAVTPEAFAEGYAKIMQGPEAWQALADERSSATFAWDDRSTYIHNPPWLDGLKSDETNRETAHPIAQARILALFGDNITTDHISPAGSIALKSPAAKYLEARGVAPADFNSYGSRRGNDEVMARGTFANIRLRNEMIPGSEGGVTRHWPDGVEGTIFDVAERYKAENTPTIIVAGRNYGMGSSRDWAAKGPKLLGVKAVIAEDFERIHRANLVGMGILPLTFPEGVTRKTLSLSGSESVTVNVPAVLTPRAEVEVIFAAANGKETSVTTCARIETEAEVGYYEQGGILPAVLRRMARA